MPMEDICMEESCFTFLFNGDIVLAKSTSWGKCTGKTFINKWSSTYCDQAS